MGPRALEMAIDRRPDLCVLATNLPLIDGHRLAEIIRVNPHTQHALFIFLTPDPLSPRPAGFREEVLQKPYAVEEVVAIIDSLFQRSERLAEVSRDTESGITGDLVQVPLPDLLQMFAINRRTGTLMLTEPGATRGMGQGFIYLKDGETINALLGHIEGEKALFRLLGWRIGRFEFIPDQAVTELRIRTPIHTLLLESARQRDEWDKLREELPAAGTELRLRTRVASLPPGIHPLTQEVLLLLEFHSRIEEIVDNCSAPDYQVLRTLHTLLRKGIVEAVSRAADAPSADRPPPGRHGPDDRLREKMAPGDGAPSGRFSSSRRMGRWRTSSSRRWAGSRA
jgi:CheY-like chemotaxis protein